MEPTTFTLPLTLDSRHTLSAIRRDSGLSDSAVLETLAVAVEDAIGKPWTKVRKGVTPESGQTQHFASVTAHVHARWCRLAELFDTPLDTLISHLLTVNQVRLGRSVDSYHPGWRRLALRLRE